MLIIPKYYDITVNKDNIQTGAQSIDETKSNIEVVYEEFKTANELLLQEMQGSTKISFTSVKDTVENKIKKACKIWGDLSVSLIDYNTFNATINTEAGVLAGGDENE